MQETPPTNSTKRKIRLSYMESVVVYQTLLDPPPADLRVAHAKSTRPNWAKEDA